jgi:hypothetical protein
VASFVTTLYKKREGKKRRKKWRKRRQRVREGRRQEGWKYAYFVGYH